MNHYIVFDFGGTSVKYACSDENGSLSKVGSFPTPADGIEAMICEMRQVFESFGGSQGVNGIAVSSPGAVDSEKGCVGGISAIPYIHEIPLRDMISEELGGLPVSFENDAICAALGELWQGAARGKKNMVSVVCGTGIGGAVVVGGRLYKGVTNNGGEFGNYIIKSEDGRYRTWSSCTLVKQAVKYEEKTGERICGKELLERSENGDDAARSFMKEFYEAMAVGFYNIQFTLDTEIIVLGGGVSESPVIFSHIDAKMNEIAKKDRFGFLKPRIVPCQFGNRANLYGALYHHIHK